MTERKKEGDKEWEAERKKERQTYRQRDRQTDSQMKIVNVCTTIERETERTNLEKKKSEHFSKTTISNTTSGAFKLNQRGPQEPRPIGPICLVCRAAFYLFRIIPLPGGSAAHLLLPIEPPSSHLKVFFFKMLLVFLHAQKDRTPALQPAK